MALNLKKIKLKSIYNISFILHALKAHRIKKWRLVIHVFQAFSLPVIQIVYETVRDALSGHKTARPAASAAASVGMKLKLSKLN